MNKLVSIIVPIYNAEVYLKCCIESLLHQTYRNIEIILVNDGSTDNSMKICLEYKGIDPRLLYWTNQTVGCLMQEIAGLIFQRAIIYFLWIAMILFILKWQKAW